MTDVGFQCKALVILVKEHMVPLKISVMQFNCKLSDQILKTHVGLLEAEYCRDDTRLKEYAM